MRLRRTRQRSLVRKKHRRPQFESVELRLLLAADTTLQFDQAQVHVSENGEYLTRTLTITRSSSVGTDLVRLVPSDGTAKFQTDFVGNEFGYVTIAFAPGEITKTVPIRAVSPAYRPDSQSFGKFSLVDDRLHEPDESLQLTLEAFVDNAKPEGQTSVEVVIHDDDPVQLLVEESRSSTIVIVNGITDEVSVRLNLQPTTEVVVEVQASPQFAASRKRLAFSADNWHVPQAVKLTGVESGPARLKLSVDDERSDPQFHSVPDVEIEFIVASPKAFIETREDGFSVVDLNSTQSAGLKPYDFIPVGAELYFSADDGVHGRELWKSDGTEDGTKMVHDIAPGSPSSTIRDLNEVQSSVRGETATVLGDYVISFADDGTRGMSVWRTNISTGETEFVRFIDTFAGVQFVVKPPGDLVTIGDAVYFIGGRSVWKTDGTTAGTTIVAQPNAWPRSLVEFQGTLFMIAGGFARLHENERSIVAIPDSSGTMISQIKEFRVVGDTLTILSGDGIWVSDGTSEGTINVNSERFISTLPNFVEVDGLLHYLVGHELWQTDGTTNGTNRIAELDPNGTHWLLGFAGGHFVVRSVASGKRTISVIDGDASRELMPIRGYQVDSLAWGNELLLVFDDGQHGREPWITDGTTEGTRLIKDIHPGADSGITDSAGLTLWGNKVYFRASDGVSGVELWETDGTSAGTKMVKDYARSEGSEPKHMAALSSGAVLFTANDGKSPGQQLWKSENGQTSIVAILPDPIPSRLDFDGNRATPYNIKLQEFVAHENKVFFIQRYNYSWASGNFQHAYDIWESDGTTEGTKLVQREPFSWFYMDGMFEDPTIRIDDSGQPQLVIVQLDPENQPFPPATNRQRLANIGTTRFTAEASQIDGNTVEGIFSHQAGEQPVLLKTLASLENTGHLSSVAGRLMFVTGDTEPNELWVSDGTSDGTTVVKTFDVPIAIDSHASGGLLYFSVGESDATSRLWRSDGTVAGTHLVSEQLQGPNEFVSGGGNVYFTALDEVFGRELWKTDGTTAGTQLVADLLPGVASSAPRDLEVGGAFLYFSADHEQLGRELWRYRLAGDPPTLVEDIDGSGTVDFADFLVLAANSRAGNGSRCGRR